MHKCSISVDIVEKLASLCFESFGKVRERRKYCILLATPINTTHHVLSAHAHNLALFVGKGRQQTASLSSSQSSSCLTSTMMDAAARAGYVLYRALVVIVVVSTKITISRDIGVYGTRNHEE